MKRKGLYFGKTQIYKFLKEMFKIELPALKKCTYKEYRGSEWFDFCTPDLNYIYRCYFGKWYYSIEKFLFDDECDEIFIERNFYHY